MARPVKVGAFAGEGVETLGPHSASPPCLPHALQSLFSALPHSRLQDALLLGFFLLPSLPQGISGGPLGFKRKKEGSSHLLTVNYLLEGDRLK